MARLKVTDEELDLLTEEERIGLKEYQAELEAELAAEDAEIAKAAAGDAEDAPVAEADEPEPEEEPEPEPEPEEEEEPEPEAEEEAEEEEEAEPIAAAPAPVQAYRLTAAEEARFTAIDTALDEIAVKFDDGEITAKEMRDQSKALVAELDELKDKRTQAKMSGKLVADTWYGSTIPLFLASHTEYVEGSMRHTLLDTTVKKLQAASTNPTDPKILVEAHRLIVAELGEPPAAEGAKPKAKAKKKLNGNGRKMPPSLNNLPASDQTPVTAVNKFARLEKLKGVDYERALARLSPTDREAYLQGA